MGSADLRQRWLLTILAAALLLVIAVGPAAANHLDGGVGHRPGTVGPTVKIDYVIASSSGGSCNWTAYVTVDDVRDGRPLELAFEAFGTSGVAVTDLNSGHNGQLLTVPLFTTTQTAGSFDVVVDIRGKPSGVVVARDIMSEVPLAACPL